MFLGLAASKRTLYVMWCKTPITQWWSQLMMGCLSAVVLCLTLLGSSVPYPEGVAYESWLYTSKPTVLLTEPHQSVLGSSISLHFKYFYFSSCRELQLAYCISSISATNLFTAAENMLWIGLCRGVQWYTVFILSLRHLLWGVVTDISAILCGYVPLWTPTFMAHIGRVSVEQKWESKLCQSYGDFELNVAHPMTKPDWNLWAALINQDAAFDAV